MNRDHEKLERLARMLCESSIEDKGRYDRKGCKRAYWRKRALPLAALASEPQGIGRTLMKACGWLV